MFELLMNSFTSTYPHNYTVAAVGCKFHPATFESRDAAKAYLGHYLNKKGIQVKEKWRDGHYVTYVCDNDVKFFISRM